MNPKYVTKILEIDDKLEDLKLDYVDSIECALGGLRELIAKMEEDEGRKQIATLAKKVMVRKHGK